MYNGDIMKDKATDGEIQDAAVKAVSFAAGLLGVDTWESLDSSHDDAMQVALMAAWKAASRFDGSCPLEAWLFMKSKYGLMDYVRELRKDREKRSSARVVQVGLDDEEVVWRTQEISLDDEDCSIQPESLQEVHGEEAGSSDSQVALRSLVETVLVGTLSERERQAPVWI